MYRWIEHTSEVEVLIEDESPRAVFAEALVALADLLAEERDGDAVTREVSAGAPDLPALLVEWLSELVYLAETDGFVPERVVELELTETSIEATVEGRRGEPQTVVKGVTYHGLELAEADGGWRARVVLDV
ncbi:MAG: archease [Solirubrobacterales bacterium]